MSLDFNKATERHDVSETSQTVKQVTLLDKENRDPSFAGLLVFCADSCSAGGSPQMPKNIGLSNYHWDEANPNKLVLKKHIGENGTLATLEFKAGKKLRGENLIKFLSLISNNDSFEITPKSYSPQKPKV